MISPIYFNLTQLRYLLLAVLIKSVLENLNHSIFGHITIGSFWCFLRQWFSQTSTDARLSQVVIWD